MANSTFGNVTAGVKLVIWDLDETLWQGTLSEEGIKSVQSHIDMIRTLVDRGIMCSICSKNDFDQAKKAVEELGIWDLFVFPHIAWSPKGQAIQKMILDMGLRDENVLFLDDNHLNLEEARFFNENLMVVDASQSLDGLLELPQLAGKDDSKHSRLAQYKVMEQKQTEQSDKGLSNTEFLRQSDIKIRVVTDIENHMDRVLELLNRTNQLNFTKVRANTPKERADLDELLAVSGMHAGLVEVQDRYGDYGIVGFFLVRTKFSGTTVHHLAFSCRTLNMGVEQWVWNYLGRPEFEIAGPVAGDLKEPEVVDWITEVNEFDPDANQAEERRLCMVGGCDLLQVSFYCGTNRDEFVNKQDDQGMLVRYDDVGFFINPRDNMLKHSKAVERFMGYSYQDMLDLDAALGEADLILLSMFFSVPSDLLFTYGGGEFGGKYWGTVPPRRFKKMMRDHDTAMRFAKEMFHRRLPLEERLELTRKSFEHAHNQRDQKTPLFILSAATEHGAQAERSFDIRVAFNDMCRAFCEQTPNTIFVDVDSLLEPEEFADSDHYTRTGYFKIADFVNKESSRILSGAPRESTKSVKAQKVAPQAPKPVVSEPPEVVATPKATAAPQAPAAPQAIKNKKEDALEAPVETELTLEDVPPQNHAHVQSKVDVPDFVPSEIGALEAPSKMERYMGFLVQEWAKLAKTSLLDPALHPVSQTNVLDYTVDTVGQSDGLRLEFGVWRGNSIKRCSTRFPDQHWYGFDSFEGFPDDGRVDWQKPFKVIRLPDTGDNVTLVKGYFSDTLDPFLADTPGEVAFVNVDCDIYSSTVDIFTALEKHKRMRAGLVIYFDELINYSDYMWNESLALFEMCERTGLGVEWICCDHKLRQPEQTATHFHNGDHPTWNDDMKEGYWMQASCRLIEGGIDCGPMHDPAYREKLRWMIEGFDAQEQRRLQSLRDRNARLDEMEEERKRRYIERKKLEKQRQKENLERRRQEANAQRN
ncbi:HAD-IIIC family phosphatase [Aliiroseovarius sp. S253]|uniref:HAD-IIIC family phosphatase n=1 Tax=Aliiroseovarius sp. S253 TaxID=3415133 RepID=UPI003C7A08F0